MIHFVTLDMDRYSGIHGEILDFSIQRIWPMTKMPSNFEVGIFRQNYCFFLLQSRNNIKFFSVYFHPASSSAKDRKHKCVSEQYVRERKSNAQKQFAYNKLKNEKHVTLKHEHQHKSNTAPKRPPQPKNINFDKNSSKEGMLIDLTSPQQQENTPLNGAFDNSNSYLPKLNGVSILDAPIDVPTQGYPDDALNAVDFLDSENSKPEPPPYQSPPTYMNTYGMTKQVPRYASGVTMPHNHYGNLDPFDTSHIATQQLQSNATMQSSYSYSTDANHSRYDSNFVRNAIQSGNNSNELTLVSRPKSSATLDLDDLVQSKMASLSPKRSPTPMAATAMLATMTTEFSETNKPIYATNDECSPKIAANSTLSDSLKVNLSSLTLNDTDDFESQPLSSTTNEQNPKLDHVFLAELEKEIYKNDNATSNVNMKNAQSNDGTTVNNKDNNAMSNAFNWLKNDFSTANNEMAAPIYQTKMTTTMTAATAAATTTPLTQSPAKVYNAEPSIKKTNFENTSSNMTLSKKLYNSDISSADMSGYHGGASNASTVNDCSVYSNYGIAGALTNNTKPMSNVHETQFNYVTTTNTISGNGGQAAKNSSYSVASDIYGSMAGGNVYDTVASSASDYYEMIQPNESQTVIYDEVAGDDLRPHRPAPVPPGLSAQQIQRRIERAQKGQSQQLYDNLGVNVYANGSSLNYGSTSRNHYVYEEINQKSTTMSNSDAIDSDSKETINAASSGTMKNLKIEQLLR